MEIEEKKEMRGCSYRTYEEWKHCLELNFCAFLFVLTVPMRNGNGIPRVASCSIPLGSYRTYEEWKLRLCSRNARTKYCSYRTYEEWKHCLGDFLVDKLLSSYRTYEEWKHAHQIINDEPSLCSYRTYEEWKPNFI